ncbi:MAG: hypothetical protein AAF198_09540 [Pseudomonadota bacterium]
MHGRLYFRTRENGAAVFRVDTENKSRRLELVSIGTIAIKKGEFRAQGDQVISLEEADAIQEWIISRKAELNKRQSDDLNRFLDDIKTMTHTLQTQTEPDDIAAISEEMLLALHDLRSVLVRKKSES